MVRIESLNLAVPFPCRFNRAPGASGEAPMNHGFNALPVEPPACNILTAESESYPQSPTILHFRSNPVKTKHKNLRRKVPIAKPRGKLPTIQQLGHVFLKNGYRPGKRLIKGISSPTYSVPRSNRAVPENRPDLRSSRTEGTGMVLPLPDAETLFPRTTPWRAVSRPDSRDRE